MFFNINFTNVRGFRENFFSVYVHLMSKKPDILALCETKVSPDTDVHEFAVNGYALEPNFSSQHGIAIFIRDSVPYTLVPNYPTFGHTAFNYIRMQLHHTRHTSYFCFIYRSPSMSASDTIDALNSLSKTKKLVFGYHRWRRLLAAFPGRFVGISTKRNGTR